VVCFTYFSFISIFVSQNRGSDQREKFNYLIFTIYPAYNCANNKQYFQPYDFLTQINTPFETNSLAGISNSTIKEANAVFFYKPSKRESNTEAQTPLKAFKFKTSNFRDITKSQLYCSERNESPQNPSYFCGFCFLCVYKCPRRRQCVRTLFVME
jgi:hypothetical protein